ncbi:hypothetical protein pb186bvf_015068 [Paramecium bursaria]
MLQEVLQIYEFLKSFSHTLNIRSRFSVEQICQSLAIQEQNIYSIPNQIVVGILDKFCTFYLIDTQSQTNSAILNILGQVKNLFVRRSILFQIWPTIFGLINRIYRIRNCITNDYQQLKDDLQMPFCLWTAEKKIQLIQFLIDTICYESDFIINQIQEKEDIKEGISTWRKELPKKEASLKQLLSQSNVSKKKQKLSTKHQQQIQQVQQEIEVLKKAATFDPNQLFSQYAHEALGDGYYVFLDEKNALYQIKENCTLFEGELMLKTIQSIKSPKINQLKKMGYFNINKTPFEPVIVDRSYLIESVLDDEMKLEYFQNNDTETIRNILISLEEDYSEYELKYWKSGWTSAEKRKIWKERVLNADLEQLTTIIQKIPHQLSFVNKKHGSEIDPEIKFKSSRLYWFYQNKLYSMPYQQLSKSEPNQQILYLLIVTLYEKLKSYIHKKMRQIDTEEQQSNLGSTQSSKCEQFQS